MNSYCNVNVVWIGLCLAACGSNTEETQPQTTTTTVTTIDTQTSTTPTTTTNPKLVDWMAHGIITCEDPEARENEGPLYEPDLGDDWNNQEAAGVRWPEAASTGEHPGYGITVVDINGDDIKDIILPFFGENRVFVGQNDGSFANETETRWLSGGETRNTEALIAADINGDGFMDMAEINRNEPNRLFMNDGQGIFSHAEAEAGDMSLYSYASVGAAWGDMDRDGNLDLVVSNHWVVESAANPQEGFGDPNQLFRLGSDGVLSQVSKWPKEQAKAYTFVSSWFDLNDDLWPDLYFSNDYGPVATSNVALMNNEGKGFTDKTEETWLGASMGAMGIGFGDTNDDGSADLIISNWGPIFHYESFGDGTWYQKSSGLMPMVETRAGPYCCYPLWGLALEDMDNDGDLDIPLAGGQIMDPVPVATNPSVVPNFLYIREDGGFVDKAPEWGFDKVENHRGLVVTDMNNDGYLDLLLRDINGHPFVGYSRCGEGNWVKIQLTQPGNNHYAIGARVDVTAGEKSLVRWVTAGSTSFASSVAPEVHFGLDTEDLVDVKVTWPDGMVSIVEGVSTNQTISAERLQGP